MFYRVDYILAVMAVGFLAGAILSRTAERIAADRLARVYYAVTVVLLAFRTIAFAWTIIASQAGIMGRVSGGIGDLLGILFGAAFGLALRRRDARAFLTASSLLEAFYLALAFTFVLAGIGKAFSVAPMTEFFHQSGYSTGFLKFIVIAEIFGGVGLLLPWARIPAWFGLTIDMFGAVLTHIHNGDPLNDSTGAIGMLIRLVAVAILFGLQAREQESLPTVSRAIFRAAAATALCLCIAIAGGTALRHHNSTAPATVAPAK